MGPIEHELRAKQQQSFMESFYAYLGRGTNKKRLSNEARFVVNQAYRSLIGVHLPCNEYYYPDAMSEALEAAEALAL